MRPGPAAKPDSIRALQGNPGKRRRRTAARSKPEATAPDCPAHLVDEARAEWERIVPELLRLGLLARVDRAALAAYCVCWSRWTEAERFMQEHGTVATLRDDKGNVRWIQAVPQMAIAQKMLSQMRAFLVEFGLTPASRARLVTAPAEDKTEDPFEKFMAGRPN